MTELSFEYWNKLAEQTLLISSLLGGFSVVVLANLLIAKLNSRLIKSIMVFSIMSASFFLLTLLVSNKILLMTTEGYPFRVENEDLFIPRILIGGAFYLGIISLITVISLVGWTKSKKMGIFSTIIGVLTFLVSLSMI